MEAVRAAPASSTGPAAVVTGLRGESGRSREQVAQLVARSNGMRPIGNLLCSRHSPIICNPNYLFKGGGLLEALEYLISEASLIAGPSSSSLELSIEATSIDRTELWCWKAAFGGGG